MVISKLFLLSFIIMVIIGSIILGTLNNSDASIDRSDVSQSEVNESVNEVCDKYRHKVATELDQISPELLFQELVVERSCHQSQSWTDSNHDDNYAIEITRRVIKSGAKTLELLLKVTEANDALRPSLASDTRIFVALDLSVTLDRDVFRLRGSSIGISLIQSLERLVHEMKSDSSSRSVSHDPSRYDLMLLHLEELKGINEADRAISDTLWINKKIRVSDEELLAFSSYLITRHPDYPSWSGTDFVKDTSRVNEAGNPLQVYILTKPEKIYEEYAAFKTGNAKTGKR